MTLAKCMRVALAVLLIGSSNPTLADSKESGASALSLHDLIDAVARRESKRFIVDPRVRADVVMFGQNPDTITYEDLLSILQLNMFTTMPMGGYIAIVPDANARQMPMREANANTSGYEYVTKVIRVKSVPAASLVPMLRPLIPQQGHLGFVPCTNKLVIVDTYSNVKRIEKIVSEIEVDAVYQPEECGVVEAQGKPRR